MIKIDFEITQDELTYRDALYLPEDHSLTEEEIHALQMERFTNWLNFIKATSGVVDG